ncbi:MAG TPA: alkane 1-monooxygenase [Rhizomicrobium sp.]|jgi:alkane 1-monooxygenase
MIRYVAAFLFSAAIPLLYRWHPAAPFLILPAILIVLLGAEMIATAGPVPHAAGAPLAYRRLPILYIPVQLALIVWAVFTAAHAGATGIAALIVSVGLTTGIFGMLTAHEMIHSHDRFEQLWGGAMLSGMSYRHFRIAHVYGHHRYAATARDAATARLDEGYYRFLARTLPAQLADAWQFEQARCRKRGQAWLYNRINRDLVLAVLIFAIVCGFAGARGAIFFAAESFVAIAVLEMFNYVAHYGLLREHNAAGGLETFAPHHSWNSGNVMANPVIFNMGRHSDHHTRPSSPYETLRYIADSPELPAGYAGSILLALVPPLWRRVMAPRVRDVRARRKFAAQS